jgi:hypothetical protein
MKESHEIKVVKMSVTVPESTRTDTSNTGTNKRLRSAALLSGVKNHVSNILTKLGVRDRTQAVLRAFEPGIVRDR